MNELRMYVEHLFEGKVLTSENIELKEEIYGNLVARYEDLIAEGVPEEEALERTKESMASVDDVLAESLDDRAPGDLDQMDEDSLRMDASDAEEAEDAGEAEEGIDTQDGPMPPVDESCEAASQSGQVGGNRRSSFVVAAAIMGSLMLFGMGFAGCSFLFGPRGAGQFEGDRQPSAEHAEGSRDEDPNGDAGASPAPAQSNREILIDENGQVWVDGELGDELAAEVVGAGYGVVAGFLDTSLDDGARVESLLRSLPMGAFATDIDVTRYVETLSLAYRDLPESLSEDSIGAALAYDVTAIFCAMPLVNEVQVTITEEDDPGDESYYIFKRDDVQGRYGVRLDDEMVNEAGWEQIKDDNLYRRDFIEGMVDAAERAWK